MTFICVCEPLPQQISLLLVVNMDMPQRADFIPLSRALGTRKNKTVLKTVSLHCSQHLKRLEPSLAP